MTMPEQIAEAVAQALRGTAGVMQLYRPGAGWWRLIKAGIGLEDPLVKVEQRDGVWQIEASIGVDAAWPAGETCRAAHRAAHETLTKLGVTDAGIHLTVAHVAEG